MAPPPTDDRMLWIRNLERVGESGPMAISETEVASEAQMIGIMDYADKSILIRPFTFSPGNDGLYKYLISTPVAENKPRTEMPPPTKHGYVFPLGEHGEILELLALYTSARFFRIAHYWHRPADQSHRTKSEYPPPARRSSTDLDPYLFDGSPRDLAGFDEFLNRIRRLDESYHQAIILAAHHYHSALQQIGVNDEMVFLRLVSSIEVVARNVQLPARLDPLAKCVLDDLIRVEDLNPEVRTDLHNLFNVRKSKARFCVFLENHCRGFFRSGGKKNDCTRIRRPELPNVVKAIYDARSSYLHSGEPMYLSQRFRGQTKWDRDPSLGMTIDNREYRAKNKLPYPYFFHRLVRHCLLNFIRGLDKQRN